MLVLERSMNEKGEQGISFSNGHRLDLADIDYPAGVVYLMINWELPLIAMKQYSQLELDGNIIITLNLICNMVECKFGINAPRNIQVHRTNIKRRLVSV